MFCDLRCGNCLGEDAIPTICVDLSENRDRLDKFKEFKEL